MKHQTETSRATSSATQWIFLVVTEYFSHTNSNLLEAVPYDLLCLCQLCQLLQEIEMIQQRLGLHTSKDTPKLLWSPTSNSPIKDPAKRVIYSRFEKVMRQTILPRSTYKLFHKERLIWCNLSRSTECLGLLWGLYTHFHLSITTHLHFKQLRQINAKHFLTQCNLHLPL